MMAANYFDLADPFFGSAPDQGRRVLIQIRSAGDAMWN
jgi:hypothetical protein